MENPLAGLEFHDLRYACVTKLAEGQANEQSIMAFAGHVSRKMLERYSDIQIQAERAALDGIAKPFEQAFLNSGVHQNVHQPENLQNGTGGKSLN
ncbi:MAG: hypothetical protein M1423_07125 [Acidobacteria bacterium]|nr:hypothetical protein [Acidobacteriota bacterium]